jgi:drug/metabolite transporter superfamily protein YnfA
LSIMNTICIIGGFFGLWLWLKRQKAYNEKAKQDGGIA